MHEPAAPAAAFDAAVAAFDAAVVPYSAAGAVSGLRACVRHPELVGPRFCTSCAAALCTACARTEAHGACPSCRTAQGKPAHVVDLAWYVNLLVDSGAHAAPWFFRAALPAVGATVAVMTVVFVGALRSLGTVDDGEAIVAAFGAALAAFGLSSAMMPSMALPLSTPVSFVRRVGRATATAAIAWTVVTAVVGAAIVPGALVTAADEEAGFALMGIGALAASLFATLFITPMIAPAQAAAAFGSRGVLDALLSPWRAGVAGAVFFFVTGLAIVFCVYMLTTPFVIVGMVPFLAGPYVGGAAAVAAVTALCATMLWLQGVYAVAAMRYASDAARKV
jgi:hypothetical protein